MITIVIVIIYFFNLNCIIPQKKNCIIIIQNIEALVYYKFYEQKIKFVKMYYQINVMANKILNVCMAMIILWEIFIIFKIVSKFF